MSSDRDTRERRADFAALHALTTRWADNDVYGHVNNVVYYAYFDTAVNTWLIDAGLLAREPAGTAPAQPIGLVVETQCRYFAPLAFPDRVTVGLRVARLGTSSVRYELAVFRNDEDEAIAQGHFVHVYVDPITRRPMQLPVTWRTRLATLRAEAGAAF
jgi:acyl-CoA thioester hydrolase